MFNNYYLMSIKGKDLKRFLKYLYRKDIRFINLNIINDFLFCKLDKNNYKKILNIKTSYDIKLERVYGLLYYKEIIKNNRLFIISFIFGIIYLFFLSNIIFKIDIAHDDKDIRLLLKRELNNLNIKKYSFVKSYNTLNKIKDKILENNKDKIEWLEIERIGTKYIIRVEKRIKDKVINKDEKRHLVAKKAGIIKRIDGNAGEILKKVNDYVSRGDIIISGEIHKGDDIKDNVSASGNIYAEVWYKVKVSLPFYYYEKTKTGNELNTIKIKYLNHDFNILNKNFINKESNNKLIYSDFYNMLSINYSNDKEVLIKDEVNTIDSEFIALDIARKNIASILDRDEYIISQKKLKTIINNSTINVEVFFKVYENISEYLYY